MFNAAKSKQSTGRDAAEKVPIKKSNVTKPKFTPIKPSILKQPKLERKPSIADELPALETVKNFFPSSGTLYAASLPDPKVEVFDYDQKPKSKSKYIDSDDELWDNDSEKEEEKPEFFHESTARRLYLNSPATSDFLKRRRYETSSEEDNYSLDKFSVGSAKSDRAVVDPEDKYIGFKTVEELRNFEIDHFESDLEDTKQGNIKEEFVQLFEQVAFENDLKLLQNKDYKAKNLKKKSHRCADKHFLHQKLREKLRRKAAAKHKNLILQLTAKVNNISVLEEKLKSFKAYKVGAGLGNLSVHELDAYNTIKQEFDGIYHGSQGVVKSQLDDFRRDIALLELKVENLEAEYDLTPDKNAKKIDRGLKKSKFEATLRKEIEDALEEHRISKNTRSKSKSI